MVILVFLEIFLVFEKVCLFWVISVGRVGMEVVGVEEVDFVFCFLVFRIVLGLVLNLFYEGFYGGKFLLVLG